MGFVKRASLCVLVAVVAQIVYLLLRPDVNLAHLCTSTLHQQGVAFKLLDGRNLQYLSIGGVNDFPVVFLHPTPTSRLFLPPNVGKLVSGANIRLITVDRPGIGLSSPHPNSSRAIVDFADDLVQLLDQLKIKDFALVGHSSGSAFASGVAFRLGSRVKKLILIGPFIFPSSFPDTIGNSGDEWADIYTGLPSDVKTIVRLQVNAMPLFEKLYKILSSNIADPDAIISQVISCPQEAGVFNNDAVVANFREAIHEHYRQGTVASLNEFKMIHKSWGFSLSQIRVEIWCSSNDWSATVGMAKFAASKIPNARLVQRDDAGHLALWLKYSEEILKSAAKDY